MRLTYRSLEEPGLSDKVTHVASTVSAAVSAHQASLGQLDMSIRQVLETHMKPGMDPTAFNKSNSGFHALMASADVAVNGPINVTRPTQKHSSQLTAGYNNG